MDVVAWIKVVSLLFMLISSAIVCYITLKSQRIKNDPKLAGMGNAFSGGIFIAVALMDLIPDSVEMINDSGIGFTDLSYLLILVGYVLVFVTEKLFEEEEEEHAEQHSSQVEDLMNPTTPQNPLTINSTEKQGQNLKEIREDLLATEPLVSRYKPQPEPKKKSSYKAYVMAIALSIHSVLEGVAIGLVSDMDSLINITLGILIHKLPETLAVALALLPETRKKYIIINTIFTVASPLGVALGMMMTNASLLLQGIFMSICAGTFVYIAASEIIVEEFSTAEFRKPKFMSFMVGVVSFTLIKVLIDVY